MAESDGFIPIKPEVVVDATFGLLERELLLPSTVTRRPGADFKGAKDDTISLRLPAYAVANKRELRSSDARTRSKLHERKVDLTLTHDLQVDIPISDEELTLDIKNFANEVIAPASRAIVRSYEEETAAVIAGADYPETHELELNTTDPYDTIVDARTALNNASVPMAGRVLVVGSSVENVILKSDHLKRVDQSGSTSALRDASIGRIGGFDVLVSNFIAPREAYAYHRSAFVLASMAPVVPDGVPWGTSRTDGSFALRVIQFLDTTDVVNVVALDAWIGTAVVTDVGGFNDDGKFIPAVDPADSGADELFVRGVKLTLPEEESA